MIEIVPRSGPPEALNCPAFVCDTCRRQVLAPRNGGYVLLVEKFTPIYEASPLFVAHTGRCLRELENRLRERYKARDGWHPWAASIRIDHFMDNLAHNTIDAFRDDPKSEYQYNARGGLDRFSADDVNKDVK